MAENPSITVQVLADIKALTTGMGEAERIVGRTTQTMAKSVDAADLGNRFAKQAQGITKALNAATTAIQAFTAEGANMATIVDGIAQSLMMSGSKVAGVTGAGLMAGGAIYEAIFKTAEKARKEAEEVAKLELGDKFKAETRDLERQLQILKETDPVKKAELELQRELAKIRREALMLDAKGADAEARKMIAAKEALALEQGRQRIEEARLKTAKDTAKLSQAGAVGTVTTSLGGSFTFAQNAALSALQSIAIKQRDIQQKILDAANRIVAYLNGGGVAIT